MTTTQHTSPTTPTTIPHPLDPLSPDEIRAAARIIRAAQPLGPSARFVTIELLTLEGNALSDIGIDWTAFETGGAVNSTDGSWFITPDDPQGLAGNETKAIQQ